MFKLQIEMGNEEMSSGYDVAAALENQVIQSILDGFKSGLIFDTNGNTVGKWSLAL